MKLKYTRLYCVGTPSCSGKRDQDKQAIVSACEIDLWNGWLQQEQSATGKFFHLALLCLKEISFGTRSLDKHKSLRQLYCSPCQLKNFSAGIVLDSPGFLLSPNLVVSEGFPQVLAITIQLN